MKKIEVSTALMDTFCERYQVQFDPDQPRKFVLEVGEDFKETDENILMMMAYMADIIPAEKVELET